MNLFPEMKFEDFVDKLKVRLSMPLPGMEAQLRMAPPKRLPTDVYLKMKDVNPKRSAVLVCFYPKQESVYTVLMQRPNEQGYHSSQVSFPGGKVEKGDVNFEQTALREAYEEVGINPAEIEVIGHLSAVYIPVSNFLVHPVVAVAPTAPDFRMNITEVQEIIETDCSVFLNPQIKSTAVFLSSGGLSVEAPFYHINRFRIWGATAMMISELEEVIRDILPFV